MQALQFVTDCDKLSLADRPRAKLQEFLRGFIALAQREGIDDLSIMFLENPKDVRDYERKVNRAFDTEFDDRELSYLRGTTLVYCVDYLEEDTLLTIMDHMSLSVSAREFLRG